MQRFLSPRFYSYVNASPPPVDRELDPIEGEALASVTAPVRRRHPLAPKHYLWVVGAALVIFFALRWLGSATKAVA